MIQDPFIELIGGFLESECGVGFEEDAFRALGSLNDDQLDLFFSQLYKVDQARHHDMVVRDIHANCTSDGEKMSVIERPYSAMFTHPYNGLETPSLDELKRQLLFFNKVAIIVPEVRWHQRDLESRRHAFSDLLRSYMDLKPLVEQGSVELLPMFGFYSNEIEGGAGIIRRACMEDPAISRWISDKKTAVDEFSSTARKGDPFFDAGIRIASAVSYGHRLAATHPFVGGLYSKLFCEEGHTPNLSKIETLRNIKKIHLPGLKGFNWADVAAIRRNEDALEEWRVNLNAAISSVDPYLPPDKFVERFNAQVPTQLAQAARKLEKSLSSSSPMARFKSGISEIAVSAVAAVVTGNPSGPIEKLWEAVQTVAKAEGAKQALRFFWATRERSSGKALKSHYAVFSTPPTHGT